MKRYLSVLPLLVWHFLSADYYTEFIKYDAQPDFSRIVISYETIRGHRGVDHFNKNIRKYEKKNMFHTRGKTGDFREITRVEHIDGKEIKTIIKIIPPRGRGMGGAVPDCDIKVLIDGSMIHQSTIGLDFNANLNTTKIIIHLQESMIESYTCDGTSGISYNFWDFDNLNTTVQLHDNEVDPTLSLLTIWVVDDVELLLIDTEGGDDAIHEFKNMELGDIQNIEFKGTFRCYSSDVGAIRFRINGGVEKKIAGKGVGNFRWDGE